MSFDTDFESSSDKDFLIALQMQLSGQFEDNDDEYSNQAASSQSVASIGKELTNPEFDLLDPCPDIRALFIEFDKLYFWNKLGSCLVEWSKRMTICAGIFYLREGGIIRLSEPLLKFRPRKDLVETLLHEMIHAYLYLTRNFKDRDSHGDEFKSHMNRINQQAGTSITIYHSFHDEVKHARKHVWRCKGKCRELAPFYGYVKRSMNRAPGKNDLWWAEHEAKCGGEFEKISEPEEYKIKANKKAAKVKKESSNKIESYFKSGSSQKSLGTKIKSESGIETKPSAYIIENGILRKKDTNSSEKKQDSPEKETEKKIDSYFKIERKRKSEDDEECLKSSDADTELLAEIRAKRLEKLIKIEKTEKKSTIKPIVPPIPAKQPEPKLIDLTDESIENLAVSSSNKIECPICFNYFDSNSIESHVNTHF